MIWYDNADRVYVTSTCLNRNILMNSDLPGDAYRFQRNHNYDFVTCYLYIAIISTNADKSPST